MKKEPKNEQTQQPVESAAPATELERALTDENEKLIAENEQLAAENAKLQKTCHRLQSSADKSDAYLNQLVAIKNDFDSYKKRMKFNAEQARNEGIKAVMAQLIEVCDTFDLAQKHLTDDNLKAFEMVSAQFKQLLHSFGVEEMDVLGQPFDCMRMNALATMDYGADKHDLVVEVYKKGYVMGDVVLRYAQVVVGA